MSRSLPILFLFTFLVIASSPKVAKADAVVIAAVGNGVTLVQHTNNGPVSASTSASLPGTAASASTNLADGTLRIFDSADANRTSVASADFNDRLIFISAPGGPSMFTITFGVNVTGSITGIIPIPAGGADVTLRLGAAQVQRVFSGVGTYSEIVSVSTTVNAGQPILLDGLLQTTNVVSNGTVDFSNTAIAFLTLPLGVTFTSQSGVFLTQTPKAIPEPATLLLFGTGLAGIVAKRVRSSP